MSKRSMLLAGVTVLLAGLVLIGSAVADEPITYPAHVKTDAQKEAWRIGWPMFHGPNGNGMAIDCGYDLIDKVEDMKLVWKSEEIIPPPSYRGLRSSFATPVMADGRVYVYYTWPTGMTPDVSKISPKEIRALDTGRSDRTDRSDKPGDDIVVCIDARTGKTVWKRVFEGQGETLLGSGKGGGHGTMLVHDGKAYAFGAAGWVYCLDAETGKTIWAEHKRPSVHSPNATPVIADGVLVYREGSTLVGYDAKTGKELWSKGGVVRGIRNASFTRVWKHEGKEYFIHENICLEARTGEELWNIGPVEGGNTTAIYGDYMVCREADKSSDTVGPRCYKISPKGAKLLWQFKTDRGQFLMKGFSSPTFYKGHVIVDMQAPKKGPDGSKATLFAMIELETGKQILMDGHYKNWKYQPIVADGKYWHFSSPQWGFWIAGVDPENLKELNLKRMGSRHWAQDTSPAYACGWLFMRTSNRLACYDLRKTK
ncbi:MAG: PQQ-binding-like beta-propeller repeat protein [Phycisphaerae bacterium]